MEELGIDCQVGHAAKIRQAETRKQKHDKRDAELLLKLLLEDRFPVIWMPSPVLRPEPFGWLPQSLLGSSRGRRRYVISYRGQAAWNRYR
jgi:hypothetical protein